MWTILLLLLLGLVHGLAACLSDLDCSLNGLCTISTGICTCQSPWLGSNCGLLGTLPTTVGAAYGFGTPFEVSSWGGNAIYDNKTKLYHLYLSEMAGTGCGLHVWGFQSTVVHATSTTPGGSYTKQSTVIPAQAHNPHVIVYDGIYYIFHIGQGTGTATPACNETGPGPFGPTTDQTSPSKTKDSVSHAHTVDGGSEIHQSSSPFGPFTPVATSLPVCNNPSPFIHPNGTLFVACNNPPWSLHRSAGGPAGPWVTVATGLGSEEYWEDPFLWVDQNGYFHILAHVWSPEPYPINPISAHTFSKDGVHWTASPTQPYNNTVLRAGGTKQTFATLERPKFLWADPSDPFRPTHLFNGAAPYWGKGPDPCVACGPKGKANHCSYCKQASLANGDQANLDWSYTLVRPLHV